MNTDDLIAELSSWVKTLSPPKDEYEFHVKVREKLDSLRMPCRDQDAIKNPGAGGVSKPDFLVTDLNPQLLIELKLEGDWKNGSKAAWQLFQAAFLLQTEGIATRKLALFGRNLEDPIMLELYRALGINSSCVSS